MKIVFRKIDNLSPAMQLIYALHDDEEDLKGMRITHYRARKDD